MVVKELFLRSLLLLLTCLSVLIGQKKNAANTFATTIYFDSHIENSFAFFCCIMCNKDLSFACHTKETELFLFSI